jgi:hypothetical protein
VHSLATTFKHWAATGRALLWMFRHHDVATFRQLVSDHVEARARAAKAAPAYRTLTARQLLSRKRSRRAYLFGSGYSLNELSEEEWQAFAKHDTIGFSGSIYLKKIPLDFLLLRAWTETSAGSLAWKKDAEEVLQAIATNPCLDNTVFTFPQGLTAIFTNRLIGHRIWNEKHQVYFYLADKVSQRPHRDLRQGLVHGMSTLCSAISLAVALGYDEIVLVGVDLYDSRYFWLPSDKTMGWSEQEQKLVASDRTVRGAEVTSPHNTVHNGIISYLGGWQDYLEKRHNVKLMVYNTRSLLTKSLPVFPREQETV